MRVNFNFLLSRCFSSIVTYGNVSGINPCYFSLHSRFFFFINMFLCVRVFHFSGVFVRSARSSHAEARESVGGCGGFGYSFGERRTGQDGPHFGRLCLPGEEHHQLTKEAGGNSYDTTVSYLL